MTARRAAPYSDLARSYDQTVGIPGFRFFRRVFEALVRRYGIGFRSVADIGCGTGLFARYVALTRRVPVVAVDRSAEMLDQAARSCRGTGVTLMRQDIRDLRLPTRVDLVTANFDTMNHVLEDEGVRAVFQRVHDSLVPGGFFLFDSITPAQPSARRRIVTPRSVVFQEVRWEPSRRFLAITFIRRSGLDPPVIEHHKSRPHAPIDLARWLRQAGFLVRGVHDAVTLEHAHRRSARVVFVAQKV